MWADRYTSYGFYVIVVLLAITTLIHAIATVPSPPTAATISVVGSTMLDVTFEPPLTDGGAEVTSYQVDWDTEPGVYEIQTVQTKSWIGPNEVQTITTSAEHRDEMQVVRTTAKDEDEIQVIKTSALTDPNNPNQLGGWFTIQYDDTEFGGSVETSGPIQWDAKAMTTSPGATPRTTMQEILQGMQNIESVSVTRTGPDSNGGYEWTITFTGTQRNEGNIPQLKLGYSALTGTGADVTVQTLRHGNVLGGTFTLALDGQVCAPIAHDASAAEMQQKLEALPTIGLVSVQRSGPDMQGGYQWSVTFIDQRKGNTGDVAAMVGSGLQLTGTSNAVTVCTDGYTGAGTVSDPCLGHSIRGNQLGGLFAIAVEGFEQDLVNISYDETASNMQTKLESLPQVGSLNVARTVSPDPQRGYSWTISFVSDEGDFPSLKYIPASSLTGTNAAVTILEARKGTWKEVQRIVISESNTGASSINGSFRVTFDAISSAPINIVDNGNCSDTAKVLKVQIEQLTNVGRISINCSNAANGGGIFDVSFDTNAGDLPTMLITDKRLTSNTADVIVLSRREGTSSKLSGEFTVEAFGQRTGYVPHDVSADKMKSALEALNSVGTVSVQRSDADENYGYTWTITFMSVLDDLQPLIVDHRAIMGSAPRSQVNELRKGRAPAFNQGENGLPLGSATVTDLSRLSMSIKNLRQGVPYFARVSATNAIGRSLYTTFAPLAIIPRTLPPSAPTLVKLLVSDGHTLEAQFSPPIRDGGKTVDQYRIEWHTQALVDEVQTIRALAPVRNEVQDIITSANDLDEIQVVRLTGSGTGAITNEVQSFRCYAPATNQGGSFRIKFRGYTTDAIFATATAADLEKILEANQAYVGNVTVTISGGQTTVCNGQNAPYPHPVFIEFVSVP